METNTFYGITFPENFPVSKEHQQKLAMLLFSSPSTTAIEAYGIVNNDTLIHKIGILINHLNCEIEDVVSSEDDSSFDVSSLFILTKIISKLESWISYFSMPTKQELTLACEQLKIDQYTFDTVFRKHRVKQLKTTFEIAQFIAESVKGQSDSVNVISLAIQNFKLKLNDNSIPSINPLFIGPTGSGKGILCKHASEILEVPLILINCSEIVPEGIIGHTINKIIKSVYRTNESESFIIHFDEICKLSQRYHGNDDYKPSIQNELLRFFDIHENLRFIQGAEHRENEVSFFLDPNKQLIICSGAFHGIEDIIYRRMLIEFNGNNALIDTSNIIGYIGTADITNYGIIPELASRLSFLSPLNKLSVDNIYSIMLDSRESELKKNINFCNQLGVKLTFCDSALWSIAECVVNQELGARGISSILTQLLKNVYLTPETYKNFHIDQKYVDFSMASNKYRILYQQFESNSPDLISIADSLRLNIDFVIDNFLFFQEFNNRRR